jgi:hypothetical protein
MKGCRAFGIVARAVGPRPVFLLHSRLVGWTDRYNMVVDRRVQMIEGTRVPGWLARGRSPLSLMVR